MVNNKYLSNCNKIKKNVIKIFIPLLFSFKNNKLTKTFTAETMYYKIFYLIYNHISVIKVFFKDKKIFYNFSKYFQINLYIFLIKKKLIILNLFFYFFYTLFLTFENLEDISTNQLFFRGYKHRLKYETFLKGWIKPDHSLKFYFMQRINSISLYVLNFNIYKNFYFSKYNLFLINTKLIYKLFYYFKILQYKLQSFVILYHSFYKFEKKIRLIFAQTNCIIYKHLNSKLIFFFSLYKSFLTKNIQTKTNLSVTSLVSTIFKSKNNKIKKNITIKPIYASSKIKSLLKKKNKTLKLNNFKKLKNYFLANYVFTFFFNINFNFSYFNLFYNNILKINWLKNNFLKNKSYYQKIFMDFFIKFLIKYSVATKLMRRYDINNENCFYNILDSFINKLKQIIIIFLINFFNLVSLSDKIKLNFINFILDKFKFNLLFKTLYNCKPVSLKNFYLIIFNIFEQFLIKNFNITDFYSDLNINKKLIKTNLFVRQFSLFNKTNNLYTDYFFNYIKYKIQFHNLINEYNKFFITLMRNNLSNTDVFSIKDLPVIIYYMSEYQDRYKILKECLEMHFRKVFAKKKLNKLKVKKLNKKISFKFINEFKKIRLKKQQKQTLLQLLKRKLKKPIINIKRFNILKFKLKYLKQVKTKNLLRSNFAWNSRLFNKKFLFFSNMNKIKKKFVKCFVRKNKIKLKILKLKKLDLKKKNLIFKIKKNIYKKKKSQFANNKLKKKLFKVIKTKKNLKKKSVSSVRESLWSKKTKKKKMNNKFGKYQRYNNNNNYNNNKLLQKKKKINLKLKLKKFKNEKKKLKILLKKKIIKKYRKYLKKNKNKFLKNLKIKLIKKYGKKFFKKYKSQVIKSYKKKILKRKKKKLLKKYKIKLINEYKIKLIKKYGKKFFKKYNKKKNLKNFYKNKLIKKYGNIFLKKYNKKLKMNKKAKKLKINKIKNLKTNKIKRSKTTNNFNNKFNKKINTKLNNNFFMNFNKKNYFKRKRKKRRYWSKRLRNFTKSKKKKFVKFFVYIKRPYIKDQDFITKIKKILIKRKKRLLISKKFFKTIFLKKKSFKKFFHLKYFYNNKIIKKRFFLLFKAFW
jgi:hypothetical protein